MSELSRFNAKDHPDLIVTREDIIATIQENILDGELINDIIENVEKQIRNRAESLRRVSIPYIGAIVPNEAKLDAIEHRELMASKQRELTKEQYQKFRKDFIRSRYRLRKGMRSKRIIIDRTIRTNSKRAARMFRSPFPDKYVRTYFYFMALLAPTNFIPNEY